MLRPTSARRTAFITPDHALADNFLARSASAWRQRPAALLLSPTPYTVARRRRTGSPCSSALRPAAHHPGPGLPVRRVIPPKEGCPCGRFRYNKPALLPPMPGVTAPRQQTRHQPASRRSRLLAASRSLLEAKGSGCSAYVLRGPSHDDAVLEALRSRLGDAAFQRPSVGSST